MIIWKVDAAAAPSLVLVWSVLGVRVVLEITVTKVVCKMRTVSAFMLVGVADFGALPDSITCVGALGSISDTDSNVEIRLDLITVFVEGGEIDDGSVSVSAAYSEAEVAELCSIVVVPKGTLELVNFEGRYGRVDVVSSTDVANVVEARAVAAMLFVSLQEAADSVVLAKLALDGVGEEASSTDALNSVVEEAVTIATL